MCGTTYRSNTVLRIFDFLFFFFSQSRSSFFLRCSDLRASLIKVLEFNRFDINPKQPLRLNEFAPRTCCLDLGQKTLWFD